jgi:hypothetical protein
LIGFVLENLSTQHAGVSAPSFGSQLVATLGFARLFVILAATHLFLDAASFYQLPETSDRFLDRFSVTNN